MTQNRWMEFICDKCKTRIMMRVLNNNELENPEELSDWIMCAISDLTVRSPVHKTYCGTCNVELLHVLGFNNLESYKSMVKATEEIESREWEKKLHSNVIRLVSTARASDNEGEEPEPN